MADFWARRTPSGFAPMNTEDLPSTWKMGEALFVTVKKPRNAKLHRKAFVLLDVVWPFTEYDTKDRLRAAMTIGAGFVHDIINPMTGEVAWMPKSWAFSSMDDVEFSELYNRLIDVALRIVPNSTRDDWNNAVHEIMCF